MTALKEKFRQMEDDSDVNTTIDSSDSEHEKKADEHRRKLFSKPGYIDVSCLSDRHCNKENCPQCNKENCPPVTMQYSESRQLKQSSRSMKYIHSNSGKKKKK